MTGTTCTIKRKWNCCEELVTPKDLENHIKEQHMGEVK